MPRSFLFFVIMVFAFVSTRHHVADAARTKQFYGEGTNDTVVVSCACTKTPFNKVMNKVTACSTPTYYTACCNKAYPKFRGDCTFDYIKPKASSNKPAYKPAAGNNLGNSVGEPCSKNQDCTNLFGCCTRDNICGTQRDLPNGQSFCN